MPSDLDDTLAFLKVAQEGSFTAAARALNVPKTTLSRRIRELEHRLGAPLLHRTTRKLGLTEAGTLYLQHCADIPRSLAEAAAAVAQLQEQPRGWLRVTAPYSLTVSLLGPLLADFHRAHGEVRIDLVLTHTTLDVVAQGIDIALRLGPLPDSGLAARRLARFPNRVYASRVYLARHGTPEHPGDLATHATLATRLAQRGQGHAWALALEHSPQAHGKGGRAHHEGELTDHPIHPVMVADDPQALIGPLLGGAGLMLATDLIMRPYLAQGLVQPVLEGWVGRSPELHALFPHGQVLAPKVRAFIDFLADRLAV